MRCDGDMRAILSAANTRDVSDEPFEATRRKEYMERNGAPEEIRTPDPQIRSLVLYPAELRVLASPVCYRLRGDPLKRAAQECKRLSEKIVILL